MICSPCCAESTMPTLTLNCLYALGFLFIVNGITESLQLHISMLNFSGVDHFGDWDD